MVSANRKLPLLYVLASVTVVLAGLYWARVVLLPVALAVLLTFLLNPVIAMLHRWGVPRVLAVALVVVLAFVGLGGVGWVVTRQLTTLADELPRYREHLKGKVADLRQLGQGGVVEKLQETAQEVVDELQKEAPPAMGRPGVQETPSAPSTAAPFRPTAPPAAAPEKPVPVVVQAPSVLWQLPALLEPLATVGLVVVLVIFMLLTYADLRSRLVRLVGSGRLPIATQALDEAGQRISHYLLMQSIINGSYGGAVGLGLFLLGVPYATLWGFLAAVLRFIPYVGPAVAALLPSALSLAVFPGWVQPLLVIALIVALELASNLVMEPLLYGQSAGVSAVALLVAVAFWTWLWGPAGLFLATPLTVCLGVLGKYVPQLEFLGVLMGDEPVLEPHVRYYQRLLAKDPHEAAGLAEDYRDTYGPDALYDALLVPALVMAKRDREQETLAAEDLHAFVQATRAIVEDLELRPVATTPDTAADAAGQADAAPPAVVRILGCPARDEADELALAMFRQRLDPTRYALEVVSAEALTAEVLTLVERHGAELICIAALPPEAMTPTRYLCKRLRARFPTCKIAVGCWGLTGDVEANRAALRTAGADEVGVSLEESRNQVTHLGQLHASSAPGRLGVRADEMERRRATGYLRRVSDVDDDRGHSGDDRPAADALAAVLGRLVVGAHLGFSPPPARRPLPARLHPAVDGRR
jgi:predicted PurR-regulated permease PerM